MACVVNLATQVRSLPNEQGFRDVTKERSKESAVCQEARFPGLTSDSGATTRAQTSTSIGAKTKHEAATIFFNAYKNHNIEMARTVATAKAIGKLGWSKDAGDNPTLELVDDSNIYYEGGAIVLIIAKNKSGRWIVTDVGEVAD